MGGKQPGYRFAEGFAYTDYEQSTTRKRTKPENFLAEREAVVPWPALIGLIEPCYTRISSEGGPPPCSVATMLRIHLLEP